MIKCFQDKILRLPVCFFFLEQIYRHGDRTPIEPYPNDPWGDTKYWPTGWGQLTNVSKTCF